MNAGIPFPCLLGSQSLYPAVFWTHWFCCGHPNQAGKENISHFHSSLIVSKENCGNKHLSGFEKGQCKTCSYSLLPFPLCLWRLRWQTDLEQERWDRARPGSTFPYSHSPEPAASEGRQPPLLVKGYLQLQLTYGYNSVRTKFPSPVGVHLISTDYSAQN